MIIPLLLAAGVGYFVYRTPDLFVRTAGYRAQSSDEVYVPVRDVATELQRLNFPDPFPVGNVGYLVILVRNDETNFLSGSVVAYAPPTALTGKPQRTALPPPAEGPSLQGLNVRVPRNSVQFVSRGGQFLNAPAANSPAV